MVRFLHPFQRLLFVAADVVKLRHIVKGVGQIWKLFRPEHRNLQEPLVVFGIFLFLVIETVAVQFLSNESVRRLR